jgi:alanyl-tRNA synthetase
VAAGIRRIEARTGLGTLEVLRESDRLLRASSALLKAAPEQLAERLAALQDELKTARRELEELRSRTAGERLAAAVRPWNGLSVLVSTVEGIPVKTLRELAGDWLRKVDLVLLAAPEGEAASFLVASGPARRRRASRPTRSWRRWRPRSAARGAAAPTSPRAAGGPRPTCRSVLDESLDAAVAARS